MSNSAARGLADATRWVGVAAGMIDYLDDWCGVAATGDHLPPPKRTFASARRFLTWVLDGVALNRRSKPGKAVPTMAGLSNLTIAVEVLSSLPTASGKDLEAVESRVRSYLECLLAIEDPSRGGAVSVDTIRELRSFFQELLRQGNSSRYVEFARGELPVG